MSVRAGVWIDHQQAILITGENYEIRKIASGVEGHGGSGSSDSHTPNDFVADDKLERKFHSHLNIYYDKVIAELEGTESLLILGPGEAKEELHKRIDNKKVRGLGIECETADKMTDGQIVAKVAGHFTAVHG